MSQHFLKPLNPQHEVLIGWDRPLSSFFLQVRDLDRDEDEDRDLEYEVDPILVWLGADGFRTQPEVDPVLEEARKWAVIPEFLRERLLRDEREEGSRSSSPLMRAWFG
jgi:hypothetical protein